MQKTPDYAHNDVYMSILSYWQPGYHSAGNIYTHTYTHTRTNTHIYIHINIYILAIAKHFDQIVIKQGLARFRCG